MRLAICQAHARSGDFGATLEHMVNASRMAAEQGADLIVYSMGLTSELVGQPQVSVDDFLVDRHLFVGALESKLECPALVTYDSGWGHGGGAMSLLFRNQETTVVSSGDTMLMSSRVFEVGGVKVMPVTNLDDLLSLEPGDVDVVVYSEPFSYAHGRPERLLAPTARGSEAERAAKDANAWLVGVGSVGLTQGFVYAGGSYVMAPWGELSCALPNFEDAFAVVDIDPSFEGPLSDPVHVQRLDPTRMMYAAIRRGIADAVAASPCNGACVVVDGTLESSVVAAAAVDALGPLWVHGLVVDTGDEQAFYDAQALARNLRMRTTVQTAQAREATAKALANCAVGDHDVIGLSLRVLATSINFMPLESATKTRVVLGRSGLMDAERSLAPLGDAYSSDVFDLAGWRMAVSSVIPSGVLSRAWVPSLEGLNTGAAARTALREVDKILHALIDKGVPASVLQEDEGNDVLAREIVSRMEDMAARRMCVPYSIRVNNRPYEQVINARGTVWHAGDTDVKQAREMFEAREKGEFPSGGGLFEEDMYWAMFPDATRDLGDFGELGDLDDLDDSLDGVIGDLDMGAVNALENLSEEQVAGAVAQAMSYLQDLLRDAAESSGNGEGEPGVPKPGEGPLGMWGQNLFSQN